MIRLWKFLLVAGILGLSQPAFGVDEPWDHDYFLERSYFVVFPLFLKGGEKAFPVIVEGSLTPNVFFYSNLRELGINSGWAFSASLAPRIDARMYFVYSAPVRPPSFRPSLNFQVFHQDMVVVRRQAVSGRLLNLQFIAEHYSNGQSGCFLAGQELVGDVGEEACEFPEMYDGPLNSVNKVDGSFTTNNLGLRAGVLFMTEFEGTRLTRSHELGFTAMVHLPGRGGGIKEDQRALYGDSQYRLRYVYEDFVSAERITAGYLRVQVGIEYMQGAGDAVQPWSLTTEVSRSFGRAGGIAPYLRMHMGHDHYNLRFDESIWMVGAGLSWSLPDRNHFRP